MSTPRWLVTGARGMLGRDLVALLAARHPDLPVTAVDREEFDITDPAAVADAVAGHDVVLNCAAWTAVDDAETQEAAAFAVNAVGAGVLARACAASGAQMLQISTDYVFDGRACTPYPEDAAPAPATGYGRTKLAGEWAVRAELPDRHWIVRTAWLYGRHGGNFVATMARLEGERETVDVVDDQIGQPTWTVDLAARIDDLIRAGAPAGTYHGTAFGQVSWCGLAREVFALLGADPQRVHPVSSDKFVRPAPRPAYSVLGHDGWAAAGLAPLRDWRAALQQAVSEGVAGRPQPAASSTPIG